MRVHMSARAHAVCVFCWMFTNDFNPSTSARGLGASSQTFHPRPSVARDPFGQFTFSRKFTAWHFSIHRRDLDGGGGRHNEHESLSVRQGG